MNISFFPAFNLVLVLVVVMAVLAYLSSQKQGKSFGNALLESGVWGGSLIACVGGDYLLMALNSNHVWV